MGRGVAQLRPNARDVALPARSDAVGGAGGGDQRRVASNRAPPVGRSGHDTRAGTKLTTPTVGAAYNRLGGRRRCEELIVGVRAQAGLPATWEGEACATPW